MYAVAALRQAYWGLFTLDYSWPVGTALMVVTYNIVVDTFNTFTAVHSLGPTGSAPLAMLHSFPSSFGWQQWAGIAVFVAGLAIETVAEHTRKQFKKNPKNKGKIDDTGLWSVVRHPNYLGYTLWRVGITLAAVCLSRFVSRSAPVHSPSGLRWRRRRVRTLPDRAICRIRDTRRCDVHGGQVWAAVGRVYQARSFGSNPRHPVNFLSYETNITLDDIVRAGS
jgi:protein-S-isoprenylcysteine O-methyltransferase Ste14